MTLIRISVGLILWGLTVFPPATAEAQPATQSGSPAPLEKKSAPEQAREQPDDERPNILFIMSDDHAVQAVSSYGSTINRTPNIDRLAKEGMRFTNAFVTNSLCAPSRATILTSKYSQLNGVKGNGRPFDGSQQTLPKLMQAAGYQTAMIGKWHLGSAPTGFDHWSVLPGQGRYRDPRFVEMGDTTRKEGYVSDIITDETIEWIEQQDGDEPFFLMSHHKAPHVPHIPAKEHQDLYQEDLPLPPTLFTDHGTHAAPVKEGGKYSNLGKKMNSYDRQENFAAQGLQQTRPPDDLGELPLREWTYQKFFKGYLRVVASLDASVGRLLDYLDEAGLSKNTVVVYTTDNGFFMGQHGWFNKMWMYEESLRVPLLVRYPEQIKGGSVSDAQVLNLDFAPTFLQLAGASVPDDMQGRSFHNVLRGRREDHRESVYYHYHGQYGVPAHRGIRTPRYKLIHYYGAETWELFDLKKDPAEIYNLYGRVGYEDVTERLKRTLMQNRRRYETEEP